MDVMETSEQGATPVGRHQALLAQIADQYHRDADFRARLEQDALGVLRDLGVSLPPGLAVTVVADTATVMHLVMPPDPNQDLDDEALGFVVGGVGSYATVNCATALSY